MRRRYLLLPLVGLMLSATAGAAGLVADTYTLRVGDTISITVWNHPEFSVPSLQIAPDGKIMHAYAGELLAAGKTPPRLAGEIQKALLKELKAPRVTVSVVQFKEDWVFVTGAVTEPGAFPVRQPLSIRQAIASALGPTIDADLSKVLVIEADGTRREIRLGENLEPVGVEKQVLVGPGDTVVLGQRMPERVAVLGAVLKPGIFVVPPDGMNLVAALAEAGGAAGDADLAAARFTRLNAEGVTVDLEALAADTNHPDNVRLRDGDMLFVPSLLAGSVSVLGEVVKPGVLPLQKKTSQRLSDAIAQAGGLTPRADAAAVSVMRADGTTAIADLRQVLAGAPGADLDLQSRDTVYVPALPEYVVLGAVQQSGRFQLQPGNRVSDALAMAGGLSVEVRRCAGSITSAQGATVEIDVAAVMDGKDPQADRKLSPGDVVVIRALDLGQVGVLGEVQRAGRYPLTDARRITDLLSLAGLTRETGNAAELMRADGAIVSIDLDALLFDKRLENNIELQDGDTLLVSSAALDISVLGAVREPNRYPMRKGDRLADAIAAAGGLLEQADEKHARIIRMGGNTVAADPSAALSGESVAANLALEDGDVIVVELAQMRVAVLGQVSLPGLRVMRPGARLSDALAEAGGITAGTRGKQARLMRADGAITEIDLAAVMAGAPEARNVTLQDGDTVLVETTRLQVAVLGEVAKPGHQAVWPGARLSDAIALAGGLLPTSRATTASILHAGGASTIHGLQQALAGGGDANALLADGDTVFIETTLVDVAVLGTVVASGHHALRDGARLSDALAAAGGVAPGVDVSSAQVLRRDGTAVDVDLSLIVRKLDPAANLELADGDTVIVRGDVSETSVLGQVTTPSKVRLREGDRISDLLAGAGGLTRDADATAATLMRADGSVVEVDLVGVLQRQDQAANLVVRPGDTLVVGTVSQGFAGVVGAVKLGGLFPISKGETVGSLLAQGGGPLQDAYLQGAILRRADGTTSTVNLQQVLAGVAGADQPVGNGDMLNVPSQVLGDVAVVGAVGLPGRYAVKRDQHLADAIASAGGLTKDADMASGTLLRADGTVVSVDLAGVLERRDPAANLPVQAGDTLVVGALDLGFAGVVGSVRAGGLFPIAEGDTVASLLARGGGALPDAYLQGATLRRADGTTANINLEQVVAGVAGTDRPVANGDLLNVPARVLGDAAVVGAVTTPGRYPVTRDERFTAMIARAGGLRPDAGAATLMRAEGTSITVDARGALQAPGGEADPVVGPGDTIAIAVEDPVTVVGAVAAPGRYQVTPGERFTAVLARAGGLASPDSGSTVTLLHAGGATAVDAAAALGAPGTDADPVVAAGDTVVVSLVEPVTVVGAVAGAGVFPLKPGERLSSVIARAKGAAVTADLGRVSVVRKDGTTLAVDLGPVLQGTDATGDIALLPGDVVIVPESERFVSVVGPLNSPGRHAFAPGARLLDAIALAGGLDRLTSGARADTCTILRDGQRIVVDMAGIGQDGSAELNVPLQNGDTVIVGEINVPQVTVIGEVVREGALDIRPLSRLSEAIAKAGGFTPAAAMHQVRLVRNGEQTVFDLAVLDRGEELPDDPVLQDRDLVVVPETMHRVTVLGGVTRPGNYVFKAGDRIIDVVGQAGGWIDGKAAPNRTVLVRRLEDGQLAAGQVDLLAVSKRGVAKGNPELQDGDMIYIPPVSSMTLRGVLQTVFSASSFIRLFVE